MRRVETRLAWIALLLLFTASASNAQVGGGGSIQGTVLDSSGAALPGATVTATNVATGIETTRQTTDAGARIGIGQEKERVWQEVPGLGTDSYRPCQ